MRKEELLRITTDMQRHAHWSADGGGFWQSRLVNTAAEEALGRADISTAERRRVQDDLAKFHKDFEEIIRNTDTCDKQTVLRVVERTLFIGWAVGVPNDKLENLRAEAETARQARAGKASGEKRRKNRLWVAHAEELAKAIRAESPYISQANLAAEILYAWKHPTVNPTGQAAIVGLISELEKQGKLPKRKNSRSD